ncbi:DUF2732 family protein [Cronobacter dublinensis]|uniref:DUF2732 family protein n=1 Tax=Cronobacter dublinensis TaxID=413497 RepID=UPI00300DD249
MRNIETRSFEADTDAMVALLNKARNEERKERALRVSERLVALALHIHQKELNGIEAAELIRQEAAHYESESQELH